MSEEPEQESVESDEESKKTLSDVLHHITEAARLAASMGEEKFSSLVEDIKQRGQKIAQKSQDVARKAKEGISRRRQGKDEQVKDAIMSAIEEANLATKDDIARIEALLRDVVTRLGGESDTNEGAS